MKKLGDYIESVGNITIKLNMEYFLDKEKNLVYSGRFKFFYGPGIFREETKRFNLSPKPSYNLDQIFNSVMFKGKHLDNLEEIKKKDVRDSLEELKKSVKSSLIDLVI